MSALIPYQSFISAPRILRDGDMAPKIIVQTSIRVLCIIAKIPMRVTYTRENIVFVCDSTDHFRGTRVKGAPTYYVGYKRWVGTRVSAIRVLEVLAHSFHDYVARECLCPVNVFCVPKYKKINTEEHLRRYRKQLRKA